MGHVEGLLKDFDSGYSPIGRLRLRPRACAKVHFLKRSRRAFIALNAVAGGLAHGLGCFESTRAKWQFALFQDAPDRVFSKPTNA